MPWLHRLACFRDDGMLPSSRNGPYAHDCFSGLLGIASSPTIDLDCAYDFIDRLYQYYIYRVDPTRANEYGQVAAVGGKSDVPDTPAGKAAIKVAGEKESKKDK